MQSNPHKYEAGFTIEQHRDDLIDRLGKAIKRINELETPLSHPATIDPQTCKRLAGEIVTEMIAVFDINFQRGKTYANSMRTTMEIIIEQQLLRAK